MSFDYEEILEYSIGGNSIESYALFFIISIAVFLGFKLILTLVLYHLGKLAKRTSTKIDDLAVNVLKKIQWAAFVLIVLITAKSSLEMHEAINTIIEILIIAIVTYEFVKVAVLSVNYSTERILKSKTAKSNKGQITILSKIAKIVIWIVGLTLFLSNIGYDVTSIVAGLGIGSVAIALAVQNILGDVLSSFSIYFDKPFEIGDAIQIGEHKGHVENIGIKTTRIRTLQGEELVVPNNKLTSTELHNFGKLHIRRVVIDLALRYETPCKKIKKAKKIITELIKKTKKVDFNRVHFKEFAESALIMQVVYKVNSGDYSEYMDLQEQINLSIKDSLEKEGIQFAYPTRTVIMEKV